MSDDRPLQPSQSISFDLLLQDGLIVSPEGTRELNVAVRDGKVAALFPRGQSALARRTLDLAGMHVLPGCIDPHCHLWEKGFVAEPDFSTGTRSAIAGGVTTIIDHPLTSPAVLDASILAEKAELGERTSFCDFALHGGVSASNHSKLLGMWEAGATAFKIFMCRSGSAVEQLDDPMLLSALRHIGDFEGIALFHAENQRLLDANEAQLRATGRTDPMTLVEWRPPEVEAEAINRAAYFCGVSGAKGVFIHTSVPEGCVIAKQARDRGVNVVVETCPHYLYFSTKDLSEQGPWIKCQPPVRDPARVERMWDLIRSSQIVMIGSDHGPVDRTLKTRGLDNMWQAQGGMPSIETMIPLMLDAVSTERLTIEQIALLTSTYSARWYGLYPRKGVIAPGSDADFTVVDLNATWRLRATDLETPCGWTPYEGRPIRGRVRYSIIRGLTVAADGRPTKDAYPGYGRFCPADHTHSGDPMYAAKAAGGG